MRFSRQFSRRFSRTGVLITKGFLLTYLILCALTPKISAGKEAGKESDKKDPQKFTAPAGVWIESLNKPLAAGTQFSLNILVGNEMQPIDGLFGLSFELHYSSSTYLEFVEPVEATAGPFLEPDTYTFTRHEPENQIFFLAVSRKRGAAGQSGYGQVMQLQARITKGAPPLWPVCFEIKNISANDYAGTAVPVQAGPSLCLTVADTPIDVMPNPFTPNDDGSNDQVEFKRDGGMPGNWSILIMDRSGRAIKRLTNGEYFWDGRNEKRHKMLPGIYLYAVHNGKQTIKRGLLWLIL